MAIGKQRSIAFVLGKHWGGSPEESQGALLGAGWLRGWQRRAANTPPSASCCGKGSTTRLSAPGG